MPASVIISSWDYTIFIAAVLFFLALDLGVFHKEARVVRFREAMTWTAVWFAVAMSFGLLFAPLMAENWTRVHRVQFITGYILELSLSMDNVFVIALIFSYFGVPLQFQHRVLFWGILGALIMRGVMIWLGAGLINSFEWMLYVLGAFLVFTGVKMLFSNDESVEPEKNIMVKLTRRFFPVVHQFHGQKFVIRQGGRWFLTPLAIVLIMVETTDLIFAVDSIPAIFGVTKEPFIVFTSNVFAIMGLRSLYFVLAGAIGYFRYLKIGLSIVLCVIGLKMLLGHFIEIPTALSLGLVLGIIGLSVALSIVATRREERADNSKTD
jgi:tellurite resistance protein TerC